ncbi:sulfurtransferase complex subunit TusB [Vibrio aestuarianus]|uniref:Sulfurtransferase complex subunit TusB n=1 Tax=Vibrio aestuarianus TaxID=28171 RepID=A0A9X4IU06_9VIBR|nr:sulfurtransferase complex subunit TusB [Vibrio aestuarianus]MDE1243658.1 sulfurtransferase complex subunit TusB [Vibrio aestuarianus]
MLHIVKDASKMILVQRYSTAEDEILLIEDAVYMSNPNAMYFEQIIDLTKIYVLSEDLAARGLEDLSSPHIMKVNFSGFVDLTVKHYKSMVW